MAPLLWAGFFVVLNANGREIGSFDTQPAKFAAGELALRGTITLDRVIAAQPLYAERPAFVLARDGHWRNAYSPVPVLEAGAVAAMLIRSGLLDPAAPGVAAIAAKLTASLLISTAGLLCFLTGLKYTTRTGAALLACGFVLGTGLWPSASQTLWQHESAIAALMAAVWLGTAGSRSPVRGAAFGTLLALAVASRLQVAPSVALLALVALAPAGGRTRGAGLLPLATAAAIIGSLNYQWFGSPFGGVGRLELLHPQIHNVSSSVGSIFAGAAGLLVSPNRGLLIFSPIVLVALAGNERRGVRSASLLTPGWAAAAALVQFLVYSLYSVWWGGHTFGPRYCLDLLALLVPAAAIGVERLRRQPAWTHAIGMAALAWSIAVAATGAFCYPHDMWNIDPLDVDRHHERLWDWRDTQIARCWSRGLSPQNFELFHAEAWRRR